MEGELIVDGPETGQRQIAWSGEFAERHHGVYVRWFSVPQKPLKTKGTADWKREKWCSFGSRPGLVQSGEGLNPSARRPGTRHIVTNQAFIELFADFSRHNFVTFSLLDPSHF